MIITITKLQKKNWDQVYPKLVAFHIHKQYSPDDETALINNYIADPEKHGAEYRKYQAYRKEVKDALKKAYKK